MNKITAEQAAELARKQGAFEVHGKGFYIEYAELAAIINAALSQNAEQGAGEKRDREADRQRFADPEFNKWLDEVISDAGHTVWDQIPDVCCAWHGWLNREYYTSKPDPTADTQQQPSGDRRYAGTGEDDGVAG
jgi:hypothetical protein